MTTTNWSQIEVEATVASYMAMLSAELRGVKYVKAEYSRKLRGLLNNRSDAAIDKKHQNISAILLTLGIPYINGYKPLYNYQKLLYNVVAEVVDNDHKIATALEVESKKSVTIPTVDDILDLLEKPPEPSKAKEKLVAYGAKRKPLKINYVQKELNNLALGKAGEEFAIRYEKARLIHCGKESLIDKVEHVAAYDDSAGFDIRSFDEYGNDRFIEVKTTTCGKEFPFYCSKNEVIKSNELSEHYFLYRLFNFREKPGLYQLHGALERTCNLQPVSYIASVA